MVSAGPVNDSRQLQTNLKLHQKTHTIYDAITGNPTHYYEASAVTAHGGECLLTVMSYYGVSNRVATTKELVATWDEAWEVGLPTP